MAWNTVHKGKDACRFKKAIIEHEKAKKCTKDDMVKKVIECVFDCFNALNINIDTTKVEQYRLHRKENYDENNGDVKFDYSKIQEKYNLKDKRDIVWIKFTKNGYVGVVASSNDVNFQIPSREEEYNEKINGKWKYNSSGIIVHSLGEQWDTSFILVFPIETIPEGMTRHKIEKYVGNHIIEEGIPILDFYSHRIGGK